MTEKRFIEQNIEKWRELELLLENSSQNPERLHTLFVEVSSDLSYARTFFPSRSVRFYLNNLTQEVFDKIGKKKTKLGFDAVFEFFGHILPIEIYKARKALLISFLVFSLAVAIGAFSSAQNPDFLRIILGDHYVEMTESNINEGDPMKVYKDSAQLDMFFGITVNNIRVSFLAFVLGILAGLGTVFILISNGIMLGAFQYFFYSKGLFLTSFLTIWIHGTIEISAIIIAGAAGMVLGRGIVFPGTYKRGTALQMSALSAIRILIGTIPLFVLAGFLESFVTRMTELPTSVKAFIIFGSLAFILFMWLLYPMYYYRKNKDKIQAFESLPASDKLPERVLNKYRNFEENFALSIRDFKSLTPQLLQRILIPFWLIFTVSIWVAINQMQAIQFIENQNLSIFNSDSIWNYVICIIGFALIYAMSTFLWRRRSESFFSFLKNNSIGFLIISTLTILILLLSPEPWYTILYFVIFPPHFFVIWMNSLAQEDGDFFGEPIVSYKLAWKYYLPILPIYFVSAIFLGALYVLFVTGLGSILHEFLMWHQLFDAIEQVSYFFTLIMSLLTVGIVISFFIYDINNHIASLICRDKGLDLEERYKKFGMNSSIFETA